MEISKLEKALEEMHLKTGSQIQKLEHLLSIETHAAKEAYPLLLLLILLLFLYLLSTLSVLSHQFRTKKYEELKDSFERQLVQQKNKAHEALLESSRLRKYPLICFRLFFCLSFVCLLFVFVVFVCLFLLHFVSFTTPINSNPDEESKFLREKLQSTELYCLEIEEQLEKLKFAKGESEAKLNGAVDELRVSLVLIYFFFSLPSFLLIFY